MTLNIKSYLSILVLFTAIAFSACKKEDTGDGRYNANYPMQIGSFAPMEGNVGTEILIKGRNFSTDTSKIKISINGVPLKVINSNGTEIMAAITTRTGTGPVVISIGENGITSVDNFTTTYAYKVTTLAGTGAPGFQNGLGAAASFHFSDDANGAGNVRCQMSIDNNGNLFVPDPGNKAIRKIDPAGNVTTFYQDASFNNVCATAVDDAGNVYTAERNGDGDNCKVRKITPDGQVLVLGTINRELTAIAINKATGAIYVSAFYGDGIFQIKNGNATKVINHSLPCSVTIDSKGNLYGTHYDDQTVIKYTYDAAADKFDGGTIIAGQNKNGGWVDGIGTNAKFNRPWGITADADNNLYVVGQGEGDNSNCVRKIDALTFGVTTIAGKGDARGNIDGDGPTIARFNGPSGVAVAKDGTIYVLDRDNNTIRKITVQ